MTSTLSHRLEECEASRAREAAPHTNAAPGAGRVAGGGPRCHGGYFGSRLNFDADQK